MYDYVLQFGFDEETKNYIQNIKDILKSHNIIDKERAWLPHITIDLYDCKNQNEFIDKLDKVVSNISAFNVEFKNLNDFDGETLYIEPFNKEPIIQVKSLFDESLKLYRLERRLNRIYKPHVTLCTNDNLTFAYKIAKEQFVSFNGTVKYLWVYKQNMQLIKTYIL